MGKNKRRRQGIGWERYSRGKPLRDGQAGRDWGDDGERMSSEREDTRENAGDLIGNSCCVGCPPERENDWVLCGEDDWVKWAEKLRKLSFLKLEIMLKMDISRQTK